MTALIALAGSAVVTWLLRVLFITLVPAGRLPRGIRRLLPHVGPAVLGSVVAAALVGGPGGVQPVFLIGALVTGALAWWRGSLLTATLGGLAAVTVLQLV